MDNGLKIRGWSQPGLLKIWVRQPSVTWPLRSPCRNIIVGSDSCGSQNYADKCSTGDYCDVWLTHDSTAGALTFHAKLLIVLTVSVQ